MSEVILPASRDCARDRYYHFLLGYLLPSLTTERLRNPSRYRLCDCGPFTALLRELGFGILPRPRAERFRTLLELADKSRVLVGLARCAASVVSGFDDPEHYGDHPIPERARLLVEHLGLAGVETRDDILLIRRGSDAYYASPESLCKGGSGSARRSVPNLDELAAGLSRLAPVRSLTLEGLPLREQVRLFRSSRVVIAQHGAALTNLLWMRPGGLVVEIDPRHGAAPARYEALAGRVGLPHARVQQRFDHAPLGPSELKRVQRLVATALQAPRTEQSVPSHAVPAAAAV